jgi:hypothetical protein
LQQNDISPLEGGQNEQEGNGLGMTGSISGSKYGLFEAPALAEGEQSGSLNGSFSFLASNPTEVKKEGEENQRSGTVTPEEEETTIQLPADEAGKTDEPLLALQRDVNHVFREVDESTEYTLLTICSIAAVLAFAEFLGDKETFQKASIWAHELSKDFISNTLKTVWDLLNREIPQKNSLAALRNPTELKSLIQYLLALRSVNGVTPKLRMRKIPQKFATLHIFFTLVDIHIFPNFAPVHKDGMF